MRSGAAASGLRRLPRESEAAQYLRDHGRNSPGFICRALVVAGQPDAARLSAATLLSFFAHPHHHDLLKMGVLGILVSVTTPSTTTFHSRSPTSRRRPWTWRAILAAKYREMIEDLRSVAVLPCRRSTIHRGNSKQAPGRSAPGTGNHGGDHVAAIPNRFSSPAKPPPPFFSISSRMRRPSASSRPRRSAGPGARRRRSSPRESLPPTRLIESLLAPYTKNIARDGNLMASYITKYFNDIVQHAERSPRSAPGAVAWRT